MSDPTVRRTVIEQLIAVGAHVGQRALISGSGGNLSARVPGSDRFVITGTGTWLDRLVPDDFTELDMSGAIVGGNPTPSVEQGMHLRTYNARQDVTCVVHLHPQMTVLVDALGLDIKPITLDHVGYLGRIRRIDFLPAGSEALAEAAATASRDSNVIILAFHGCTCLGDSVPMAHRRALNLEEAAVAAYRAALAGRPGLTIPEEFAAPLEEGALV